jgi:hypothetical protein
VNRIDPRERRQCSRFKLTGDAWFRWESGDGRRGEGEGVTRNIGKEGTFIATPNTPPMASQIVVVVTLRGRASEGMEARLCGSGDVRHVLTAEGGLEGFGAQVLFRTEAPGRAG